MAQTPIHVAQFIDDLGFGGAQKLIVSFAEGVLKRSDIRLTVVCFRGKETQFYNDLQEMGVRVVTFSGRSLADISRLYRVNKFVRQENFDVIHTHLSTSSIIGVLVGVLNGIPVISTIHSTRLAARVKGHPLRKTLQILILRWATTRVVAVGHEVALRNEGTLKRTLDVIPNAVPLINALDEEDRLALRKSLMTEIDASLVISVGSLNEAKGFHDLIQAFVDVHEHHPSALLVIAGGGELFDVLQQLIADNGLSGSVKLLGQRGDVPALLAASDLFVSSSHWEGLPVAVLEAMAAGLPVIATEVGDTPNVLVEEAGVIVPPKEPALLGQAMNELLSNPERMQVMGQTGRNHVRTSYSLEEWIDKLNRLYRKVL